MGPVYPRRQAGRWAALLEKHFVPGLTVLDAPPRRGKSDFLQQVFEALLKQRQAAPVLLRLGSAPEPQALAERAAAQIIAFDDQRLRSAAVLLEREQMLERKDGHLWLDFLQSAGGSVPQFLAALDALAESRGPLCLLLDDVPAPLLRAASSLRNVAVLAAAGDAEIAGIAQVLPVEPFTTREGVLLAESVARALGVEFDGAEAEAFVAYCAADPFALRSVVTRAAADQIPLTSETAFLRAYLAELHGGTLDRYFDARFPADVFARQFAMEVARTGSASVALVQRWRHRTQISTALDHLRRAGVLDSSRQPRVIWPAARDWAVLHSTGDAGALTQRLLSDLQAAAAALDAEKTAARISTGLAALQPAAAEWLADNGFAEARVPLVCHVAHLSAGDAADLFLCHGFGDDARRAATAMVLAVAVCGGPASALPRALEALERATTAAEGLPAGVEKWVVLRNAGAAEIDAVRRAGARILDLDLLNRLLSRGAAQTALAAAGSEVALALPMDTDYEIAAVRVLDHLAERYGWEKRAAAQVRVALVEACLNAIEHGRAARDLADARMEIRIAAGRDAVDITVRNPGPPFEPEQPGEPVAGSALGSTLHRGHGLKIIRSLMDQVSFGSDLNGTTVRMSKRFAPAPVHTGSGTGPVHGHPETSPELSPNEETATRVERD